MNLRILGSGHYDAEPFTSLLDQPDFRRASRNQMMAYLAAKKCLPSTHEMSPKTGMVIGTSHGELEATVDFLSELGKTNTARPLLFQNSLHHSTLGFLTRYLGITGASLTVSNGSRTGQDAIEAAALLLESQLETCLVIGVDTVPERMQKPFLAMYPEGTVVGQGAGALLLARDGGKEFNLQTRLSLDKPYDSDLIERLARFYAS